MPSAAPAAREACSKEWVRNNFLIRATKEAVSAPETQTPGLYYTARGY